MRTGTHAPRTHVATNRAVQNNVTSQPSAGVAEQRLLVLVLLQLLLPLLVVTSSAGGGWNSTEVVGRDSIRSGTHFTVGRLEGGVSLLSPHTQTRPAALAVQFSRRPVVSHISPSA